MTSVRDHIKKSPHRTRLEKRLQAVLPTLTGPILDIGSRNRRYDALMQERPTAIDIVENAVKDVQQGDVTDLQFRGGSFNTVVCIEVLEYVSDPKRAISEMHRVLISGGTLVLSIPFMFKEHEDKQRYTSAYLRELLAEFDIQQFDAVGGSATVILTILWGKAKRASWKPLRYFGTALLLPFLIFRSGRFSDSSYASGYFIVAKKRV